MSDGASTGQKPATPMPCAWKKRFSATRSWAVARASGPGATRVASAWSRGHGARGDVLELEGHHLGAGGEFGQGVGVLVIGDQGAGGDPAGRGVRLGCQHHRVEAQPRRRQGQHPPQLAAAEHADGRPGR